MTDFSPFNLSISTLVCPAWDLEHIIQSAATAGLAGIDFRGIGPDLDITVLPAFNDGLPVTLGKLRDHGLQMHCLNSSVVLVTTSISGWESMLAEAQRYAVLAQRSGSRFLRIFGGAVPVRMTREDARNLAIEHLNQLVKICRPCGLKILIETHDAWSTSSDLLGLIEGFSKDDVGVLWDIEHPFRAGEAPVETTAALKNRIDHIHVKDTIRRNGASIPVLLGEGDLPIQDCIYQLRSANYSGWITLETEKRWYSEGPEPELSIPQFVRYMRQI